MTQKNLSTKQKDSQTWRTDLWLWGRGGGRGIGVGGWGGWGGGGEEVG